MTDPNINNLNPSTIVVYSTPWCADSKRSKALLDSHKIKYLDVDIGKNMDSYFFIEKLMRKVRVPTIIFPDGTVLLEPDNEYLSLKLGIS